MVAAPTTIWKYCCCNEWHISNIPSLAPKDEQSEIGTSIFSRITLHICQNVIKAYRNVPLITIGRFPHNCFQPNAELITEQSIFFKDMVTNNAWVAQRMWDFCLTVYFTMQNRSILQYKTFNIMLEAITMFDLEFLTVSS